MNGNKSVTIARFCLASLFALFGQPSAWACATCGLNKAFTPATLLISFGFFLLPVALVSWIGWQIYKDSKGRFT
jgi:hypothetical protein